jgi:stage V sporulation protein SpoVS
LGVLVDVDLHEANVAFPLRGQLLESGSDLMARPTPVGIEVDDDATFGVHHVPLEVRIR